MNPVTQNNDLHIIQDIEKKIKDSDQNITSKKKT